MKIINRTAEPQDVLKWLRAGKNPVVAKALAARNANSQAQLLEVEALKGAQEMAKILADAIDNNKHLLIVADYDCDGATACAIGVRGLRMFGASVSFIVPDRNKHGYGLSPAISELACAELPHPDYIITVDNGIASHAGVDRAKELGVPVLVTDHHLPGETQPDAEVIVNPNQHGCTFPSKSLAGCGVIWYVMWALQQEMASRGVLPDGQGVFELLPLVAVGTVADVVRLDDNNRILVQMGLERIRNGKGFPGIDALALAAGRDPRKLSTSDIGFGIGPRINAAGRLADMSTGIECLLTDSVSVAENYAQQLNTLNNERKSIEKDMAVEAGNDLVTRVSDNRYTVTLTGENWHAGVVGIVAGRIKERVWRPTFAMAKDESGQYKGSGRSIPGFHLRDALDLVDRRHPGLLIKFGGHAMAAGLTLRENGIEEFEQAFEEVAHELINPEILNQEVFVDGSLPAQHMTLGTIEAIKDEVWGQGFPEPAFLDTFDVLEARMIGKDREHLKMTLQKDGVVFDAVHFRYQGTMPVGQVKALFKLDANTWNGKTKLQILVDSFV